MVIICGIDERQRKAVSSGKRYSSFSNVILSRGTSSSTPPTVRFVSPLVHFTLPFRLTGISESEADSRCADVYRKYRNPVTTILAAPGDIQIHLRARCREESEAEALLESGEVFESAVIGFNRGGVICRVGKVRGFIPQGQVERACTPRVDLAHQPFLSHPSAARVAGWGDAHIHAHFE